MIKLDCCGETYFADEAHVGSAIKCRKCGRTLVITATTSQAPTVPANSPAVRFSNRSVPLGEPTIGRHRWPVLAVGTILGAVVTFIFFRGVAELRPGTVQRSATNVESRLEPIVDTNRSGALVDGSSLPLGFHPVPAMESPTVRLPSGTWIVPRTKHQGHGVLQIQNGTDFDSLVKLVTAAEPRSTEWAVYIRAHNDQTVTGIGAGRYLLQYALGEGWDAANHAFQRDARFFETGTELHFTEANAVDEDHPGHYKEIRVTLHLVSGGNMPRKDIPEAVFAEGDSAN